MTYNLETERRGSLPNCAVQLGGQSAGLNVINKYVWVSTHKSLKTCCFSVYQQRIKNLLLCKLCVCLQSPVRVIRKNLQLLQNSTISYHRTEAEKEVIIWLYLKRQNLYKHTCSCVSIYIYIYFFWVILKKIH